MYTRHTRKLPQTRFNNQNDNIENKYSKRKQSNTSTISNLSLIITGILILGFLFTISYFTTKHADSLINKNDQPYVKDKAKYKLRKKALENHEKTIKSETINVKEIILHPELLENDEIYCVQFNSNNKKVLLKAEYINDDYCDCIETGEDEINTSACSNIVKTSYFNCNEHIKIPKSRINDGICDCGKPNCIDETI